MTDHSPICTLCQQYDHEPGDCPDAPALSAFAQLAADTSRPARHRAGYGRAAVDEMSDEYVLALFEARTRLAKVRGLVEGMRLGDDPYDMTVSDCVAHNARVAEALAIIDGTA